MKIKGTFADGFSGSLAGITASRNKGGDYLRERKIPVNPNSTRQQLVRSNFDACVQRWVNVLTAAQRTAWNTYAFNTPIGAGEQLVTGQNQFIRTNTPRLQAGGAFIDAAPVTFDTGAPVTSITAQIAGTANQLTIDNTNVSLGTAIQVAGGASDDGDVLCYLGNPVNPSRGFYKGPYQLASVLPIASAAAFVNWSTLYTALTSDNTNPAEGQNRGVRFRVLYDDGRLTESFDLLSIVLLDDAV